MILLVQRYIFNLLLHGKMTIYQRVDLLDVCLYRIFFIFQTLDILTISNAGENIEINKKQYLQKFNFRMSIICDSHILSEVRRLNVSVQFCYNSTFLVSVAFCWQIDTRRRDCREFDQFIDCKKNFVN